MKHFLYIAAAALVLAPGVCEAQAVSGPRSVALTVYNGGFALVKDTRTITLKKGVNSIEVADVAAKIDPTSILFKPITSPNSVSILEQNYQYDLISPNSILKKLVGERVWFNGQDSGILLNPPDNGGLVVRKDDGKLVTNVYVNSVDKLPEGLKPTPTLNWLLASDKAGAQNSQINYITDGIGWKADYVVLVNDKDTKMDLNGWVTMDNKSGATYKNAKLTLMAGDVRREPAAQAEVYRKAKSALAHMDNASQFQEKSFFEYHMYTMARETTIGDKETKQLSLLNASEVPIKKEMIYDPRGAWFRSWWIPGRTNFDPDYSGYDTSNYHKVNVVLEAVNSKANHMGMPLPAGKIRVYKLDDTGSQQFIGEDMIDHTPKDEKIKLYIGDAFDVVANYKRTDYKRQPGAVIESFEVVLRNHKDSAVNARVVEHVWGDWAVTAKTHAFTKKDAHTIEFPVRVPANGSVKINYTIRTK